MTKNTKVIPKFWHTEYNTNHVGRYGKKYGSYVIGNTRSDAETILKKRDLGKRIIDLPCKVKSTNRIQSTAKAYKKRDLLNVLHTLSFVGNILLNINAMKHSDLLSDVGMLHEVIHELQYPSGFRFSNDIYQRLKMFDVMMKDVGF